MKYLIQNIFNMKLSSQYILILNLNFSSRALVQPLVNLKMCNPVFWELSLQVFILKLPRRIWKETGTKRSSGAYCAVAKDCRQQGCLLMGEWMCTLRYVHCLSVSSPQNRAWDRVQVQGVCVGSDPRCVTEEQRCALVVHVGTLPRPPFRKALLPW